MLCSASAHRRRCVVQRSACAVASLGCDCPPARSRSAGDIEFEPRRARPRRCCLRRAQLRARDFVCFRWQHPAQPRSGAVRSGRGRHHTWRIVGADRWPPGDSGDHRRSAAGGQRGIGHRTGVARRPASRWSTAVPGSGRRDARRGRRGVPRPARPVRRGRNHPGSARTRRGAVRRRGCAGQRRGHGQGVHQEAARGRGLADRRPRRAAAEQGHGRTRGSRAAWAAGVRQTRARRLVHRCQPGNGMGPAARRRSTWPASTTRR